MADGKHRRMCHQFNAALRAHATNGTINLDDIRTAAASLKGLTTSSNTKSERRSIPIGRRWECARTCGSPWMRKSSLARQHGRSGPGAEGWGHSGARKRSARALKRRRLKGLAKLAAKQNLRHVVMLDYETRKRG